MKKKSIQILLTKNLISVKRKPRAFNLSHGLWRIKYNWSELLKL